ncbi:GDSL esterase/lipase [Vitis vinifera]|uniref:GDSL esterase/lipase n=1 Tax=Vitis vinifera TaxID=29760 RepID=A0A438GIM7_VITVI|nr:GDSL esterase/lipase [Vitis vinifera]
MASSFKLFSSLSSLTTILILILLSSLCTASTAPTGTNSPPFKRIYAFGDSYTDTGNTRSATGPNAFTYVSNLPYGSTFFHHPTNRYSDGRLVIDFVAQALSLPFLPPYRSQKANTSTGVNFAVAGSTAIPHEFFVKNNLTLDITPQSIQTQLIWFNEFLEKQGCRGPPKTLVAHLMIHCSGLERSEPMTMHTLLDLLCQAAPFRSLALLKKGVKYLVVQGLPPTGCLTLALTLAPDDDRDAIGCVGSVNKQSYSHNTILQAKLHDLRVQFPHAVIVYADYWNAYHTIMKNGDRYGFKEPFKTCCGSGGDPYNFDVFATCGSSSASACPNPSQYINWDGVHLTEAMYKVVANSFLHGGFCHPPFDYLLSRKQHLG